MHSEYFIIMLSKKSILNTILNYDFAALNYIKIHRPHKIF